MDYEHDAPVDRAFNLAFDHFLRLRGWSVLSFCRATARLSESGAKRLILPNQITNWRKDQMPNSRSVLIVCETLGVERSYFYAVGQALHEARGLGPRARGVREGRMAAILGGVPSMDERLLRELESAIRHRRRELGDE